MDGVSEATGVRPGQVERHSITRGAPMSVSPLATTKAFRPVRASNGTCATCFLSSSSMSTPPLWVSVMVGRGTPWNRCWLNRPHPGPAHRFRRSRRRLRGHIAVVMFREKQALFLRQGRLEITRLANQPGLALLADTTFEQRFDEDELMPIDEILGLRSRLLRAEDFGGRKVHVSQQA